MRYADPSLCPDCRSPLPAGRTTCPTCGLLVRHELAVELFGTLQRADQLVTRLRSLSTPSPAPAASPVPPSPPTSVPSVTVPPLAPYPAAGTGVRFASVPKILLGLGALCLLVAAVVFLAVSWSWLGVGGRTAVLVGLTAAAAAAALWLNKHELRIAAEALSTVALGLLSLDVLGAESAGWLGDPSAGGLAILLGAAVAVAGTALALPRPVDGARLAAPQVAAALGFLAVYAGALDAARSDLLVGHATVAVGAAAAWMLRRRLPVEAWGLLAVATCVWAVTLLAGAVSGLEDPTLDGLWVDGAGWSLLGSAAALLLPGALLRDRTVLVAGGSGAALLATVALTLPTVDEGAATLGTAALAATLAWTVAHWLLPAPARPVALAPGGAGSMALLVLVAVAGVVAVARVATLPTGSDPGVGLTRPAPVTEPLLTVPSVLVVVAFLGLAVRGTGLAAVPWWHVGGLLGALGGVVTLASYDVPLALVVTGLGATAAGSAAAAFLLRDARHTGLGLAALVVAGFGVVTALPSTALTAVAAGVALAVAALAHLAGRTEGVRVAGALALAPALGTAVWASGAAADVDAAWLGVPVLLSVGALALARPRVEVEVPALAVAVAAVPPAVLAATDSGGSLALHLTVAGALLCATALLHESRRATGWAGAALLFLATWVRLADLGVSEPEPYTLPLAVALLGVGLVHLRRHPRASTATALLPGLVLGTVPSLLWVLDDPVSLRALLLGAGCVVLAVAGAALRWSAPLVVGAAVGAVLALRELGPYAAEVPQWIWLGLAGALLTTVGITWERRLRDLRKAFGYLGRLR